MKGSKALTFNLLKDEIKNKEQDVFEYLDKNISDKKKFNEQKSDSKTCCNP